MTSSDWNFPGARSLALYLDGADSPDRAADGTPLVDDDFLLLVNAWWEPLDFAVPPTEPGETWDLEFDTYQPDSTDPDTKLAEGNHLTVRPRSIVLLRGHRTANPS
jgi:isoamylase